MAIGPFPLCIHAFDRLTSTNPWAVSRSKKDLVAPNCPFSSFEDLNPVSEAPDIQVYKQYAASQYSVTILLIFEAWLQKKLPNSALGRGSPACGECQITDAR